MSATVEVRASYDCDPDHVERVLLDIAAQGTREIPGLLADPAPTVTFDPGFGESGLGLTLNYQVAEFASQFSVRHELRKRILRRFKEEGIRIPYPARAVYMHAPEAGEAAEAKSGPRIHKGPIAPRHRSRYRLPLGGVRGIFGARLIATANPAEYSERRNRRTACVSPRLARFQIVRRME